MSLVVAVVYPQTTNSVMSHLVFLLQQAHLAHKARLAQQAHKARKVTLALKAHKVIQAHKAHPVLMDKVYLLVVQRVKHLSRLMALTTTPHGLQSRLDQDYQQIQSSLLQHESLATKFSLVTLILHGVCLVVDEWNGGLVALLWLTLLSTATHRTRWVWVPISSCRRMMVMRRIFCSRWKLTGLISPCVGIRPKAPAVQG